MPATLKFSVLTLMGFVLLGHAGHFQTVNVRSVPVLIDGSPVNCSHTAQSSDGFLWLATSKGLCRHDGVHTIAVSLPSDTTITALEVIGDTLFVGFEDGNYCHFMLKSGQHGPLVKAGSTRVTAFAKLGDMMFISLYGEGLRVDYRLSMQSITTKHGLPDDYVYDVVSLGDKVVAATDMGISLIDRLGKVVQNLDKLDGLSDNLSTTLLRISDSEVLVGYDNGKVDIVHLSSMKISHLTSIENVIKSRITDACLRGDHIWIASSTEGLATFTWPELKLMDHYPATGWGAEIVLSNVMADQEGHVILCGNQSQVLIFDPRILRITQHDGIDFTGATALTVDRGGNLWFASDDGIFFHGEEFITANRLKTLVNTGDSLAQYVCMSEDADGNMWLGTFGKGIARYSPPTGELRWYTEADGLVNNNVLDIKADGRRLWFSTLGGVSLMEDCNRYEFRNFGKADGLGSSYVYCAIADNEGNMLFGTDGAGVMVYDQGSFRPLMEESRVSPRNVVRMAVDGKGRIWILEASGKMKVYDHGKLTEKRLVHNGQELTLFTLTTCADGSIAVLTNLGIASLTDPSADFFISDDGIEVHSDFLNVLSCDRFNNIWAATSTGMLRYKAGEKSFRHAPKSFINAVQLFLEPVDTLGQHNFRPAENHISFSFGSIWLTAPGDVSYEYMLEGYNSEWTATRDQFVAFPQLGPGDYRFRVRSIVGNRTGSESTYSFTIAAPYWTKGWFIALVIIGITGLGTYLIRLRISALRKRDAIAKERLQSQFDTLRNQVNPHFLFNSFNTLTAVIEKDQALAVDYVGKLSDFFRTILQQQNKEVITLSEELELLNTYFYLQRQRFGDNLQMQIDIPEAWMNAAIPPLTLQLLAENAIKHNVIARHKPLIIKLYGENETLVFRNNLQEKTVREKSTGIGLQNILNRYKILFKAEVVVEKSEAFFTVRLPLLNLMHER